MIDRLIQAHLEGFRASRILDLGPGYNDFSRLVARCTDARVVTYVDYSGEVLEWQRARSEAAGLNVETLRCDASPAAIEALPGDQGVILCQEVLEHLENAPEVLRALAAGFAALYAVTAPLLTPWVFGDEYAEASRIGTLLCIRYALAILICPIGIVGYGFGLVTLYWRVNLAHLVIVLATNSLLIPRIGAVGACVALLVNEVSGAVLTAGLIYRRVRARSRDITPSESDSGNFSPREHIE